MAQTVVLTGASGFIARHVLVRLLDRGYRVRASLRDKARGPALVADLRPFLADPDEAVQRLDFVSLDLDRDAGWDAALAGADALVHTASPFPLGQPKDPEDLIRPAVEGTLRALRAAHRAGVARVVITSSSVAIEGLRRQGSRALTEADWTDPDAPGISAYGRSKTLAERAAWAFVETDAPEIRLTTINPGLVLGRPVGASYGSSVRVIERILEGKDPLIPDLEFGAVDVGDVALAHVRALETPEAEGKRIIAVGGTLHFRDMARLLRGRYPERRIASRVAPNLLMRTLGLFDPAIRSILPNLGRSVRFDASRARDILGITFRDPGESAVETAEALVALGRGS